MKDLLRLAPPIRVVIYDVGFASRVEGIVSLSSIRRRLAPFGLKTAADFDAWIKQVEILVSFLDRVHKPLMLVGQRDPHPALPHSTAG